MARSSSGRARSSSSSGRPSTSSSAPSMTVFERAVNQISPHLRPGSLVVLRSTVYPGTTGYVTQRLGTRLRRGRRVLPGADRRGPCARGAPDAAPDRRRGRRPVGRPRVGPVRAARAADDPDDVQGGRARQAVHEHLAVHEVRRREPVLHDRGPGRRGLHERPGRDPDGLSASRRTCRAPASPPARACSRTRCSSRPSRATTSRSARRRCR